VSVTCCCVGESSTEGAGMRTAGVIENPDAMAPAVVEEVGGKLG
jgi:hypothetical protein